MENLYTWCGTAACANTCMCLLASFMEKMAFFVVAGAINDQHQIRVLRMVVNKCVCACVLACVLACLHACVPVCVTIICLK